MNYQLYEIKGPHCDTKRNRTIKVNAFSIEDAKNRALNEGIADIQLVEEIPHPKPSENQIEYAKGIGIEVLDNYTDLDVSALLSRYEMRDSNPNQGLIEFATNKGIMFSLFIGKTALYNKIFAQLDEMDRIAFFIFCIYRYISDDRHANLDTHPKSQLFYDFAHTVIDDERFIKSLNRYDGKSIKFFGVLHTYGSSYTGGSVDTIAFKTARSFLIENNLISETAPYRSKHLNKPSTSSISSTDITTNEAATNIANQTIIQVPGKKYYELPKYELPTVISILILLLILIFVY